MKIKVILISTLLLSLYNLCSQAQISFKYEYIGSSDYYMVGEGDDDPREKVGDAKGSAMVYQGSINIPLSMKTDKNDRPVIWGVGLGGTYVSFNNQKFTEQLVISEIMNAHLSIYHMRHITEKWALMASVGVGIYSPTSNLSKLRARHILGSVGTIAIYNFSDKFQLGGGLAIDNSFGIPMIFPAIYLNWNLPGRYDILLSMTNGLELSAGVNINKFLKLSLIAEMDGQAAALKKDDKEVIFNHQYIVAGFRPEIKLSHRISIPITAGVNTYRPASYSDRKLKTIFADAKEYYFQISPYVSAGVTVNF